MDVFLTCVYIDWQIYALNPNDSMWKKTSKLQMEAEEEWVSSISSIPKKTKDLYVDDGVDT